MRLDLTLDEIQHQQFYIAYRDARKNLRHTTRFDNTTIEGLLMVYHKFILSQSKPTKSMTLKQFADFFQIYLNMPGFLLVEDVAAHIDPRTKGGVSAESFVKFLDVILNGSLQDKIDLCFGVYVSRTETFITRQRIAYLVRHMMLSDKSEDGEQLCSEYADFLVRKFDLDGDGKISFEDYSGAVQKNPGLLEFIGKIFPDDVLFHGVM